MDGRLKFSGMDKGTILVDSNHFSEVEMNVALSYLRSLVLRKEVHRTDIDRVLIKHCMVPNQIGDRSLMN